MRSATRFACAWLTRFALTACALTACARDVPSDRTPPATPSARESVALASATTTAVADASASDSEAPRRAKPERVVASADVEVASFVRTTRARALREGRKVVVEVGASWCKPCRTLAAAIDRGDLDEALGNVTVIAFDADAHGPRLDSLGYRSKFVPFFAVPNADGTASARSVDAKVPADVRPQAIADSLAPLLR